MCVRDVQLWSAEKGLFYSDAAAGEKCDDEEVNTDHTQRCDDEL